MASGTGKWHFGRNISYICHVLAGFFNSAILLLNQPSGYAFHIGEIVLYRPGAANKEALQRLISTAYSVSYSKWFVIQFVFAELLTNSSLLKRGRFARDWQSCHCQMGFIQRFHRSPRS
jgi:hypothetical protein